MNVQNTSLLETSNDLYNGVVFFLLQALHTLDESDELLYTRKLNNQY